MTSADRPPSRRPLRRLAAIAALVAVAVAAFGAAMASSTANKPYSAFISAPPSHTATTTTATTSVGGNASVGVRLRNDNRTQRLGSANITLPAGVTVPAGSVTLVAPAGGSASVSGQVVQLRNLDLAPGAFAFVRFAAVVPCTASRASYTLAITAKQSNDFNGTGNDLTLATPAPVLAAIGSCVPCTGGRQCTANTSTSASLASVSGVATSTGDRLRVSLGAPDAPAVDCSGYAESTETVAFDLSNAAGGAAGGLKTVKLQITSPTKAASLYKICFQAGDTQPPVILPACKCPKGGGVPSNAPCAQPAELRKGVVTLTAITPAGDPWIKG